MALITLSERRGLMLDTFIQRAIKNEPITIYGNGKGVREYIYVKDAAAAIEAAINASEARGIFNIGSGVATSHQKLAELVRDIFSGGVSKIVYDQTKAEASSRYPMDRTLARKVFGWEPKYSLKRALEDMKQENIAKGYDLLQKSGEIGKKLDDIDKENDLSGKTAGIK
jgi:nucleoside-diphosphate-sugar epimerase